MSEPSPRVSIVMPLRDGAQYLRQCLQSIVDQSLRDFELLVVDDGSTDSGASIVEQFANTDSRIRLARRPAEGIVSALNVGLQLAQSAIVARMDADDVMHPQRLQLQFEALMQRDELVLVACCVEAFPDAQVGNGMREYLRWQNSCRTTHELSEQIYVESVFVHPSVMFRRDRIVALGGYRDGDFPEDYELWLRVNAAGDAMCKLDEVLLRWRQHERSLSRIDPRYARHAFDRLRARYLALDPRLQEQRPLAIWGAGRRTRKRCEHLLARGFALRAWIDIDPQKIGQSIAQVPVHGPNWLAEQAAAAARPFVLVYVANHGARDDIAASLNAMGYASGADYLMVG